MKCCASSRRRSASSAFSMRRRREISDRKEEGSEILNDLLSRARGYVQGDRGGRQGRRGDESGRGQDRRVRYDDPEHRRSERTSACTQRCDRGGACRRVGRGFAVVAGDPQARRAELELYGRHPRHHPRAEDEKSAGGGHDTYRRSSPRSRIRDSSTKECFDRI